MGSSHLVNITKEPKVSLVAVCDVIPERDGKSRWDQVRNGAVVRVSVRG